MLKLDYFIALCYLSNKVAWSLPTVQFMSFETRSLFFLKLNLDKFKIRNKLWKKTQLEKYIYIKSIFSKVFKVLENKNCVYLDLLTILQKKNCLVRIYQEKKLIFCNFFFFKSSTW